MIKIENKVLFKSLLILSILLFFIHFLIISFFYKDVGSDNAIWHYIGWNWYNYKDIQQINIIDNKPPGIHFLYYLTSKYYGVNFLPIKIIFIIFKIITGILIYKISFFLTSNKEISLLSLLSYFLILGWNTLDNYQPVYTEVVTTLISTSCLYIYLRFKNEKIVYLIGFLFAVGFYFKQTTLIYLFGFLILIFFVDRINPLSKIIKIFLSFLFSFGLIFIFFLYLGLNFEGLIFQLSFFFNFGADTLIQISSRIKHFLIRWTGPERSLLLLMVFYLYFFVYISKEKLHQSLFFIFVIVLAGAHATGTITGHHLIEVIPLFLILLSLILAYLFRKFEFLRENIVTILVVIVLFVAPINLGEYKIKIKNYSIKDPTNKNIETIKNYLHQYISGPKDMIYIHQRDAELVLNLKMRTASDFHINTFLYNSYDDGSPIIDNIEKVKKQLLQNKPKIIILLNNYLNEAPYLESIDYFDEILGKYYRLDRSIDKYNFFVLKK